MAVLLLREREGQGIPEEHGRILEILVAVIVPLSLYHKMFPLQKDFHGEYTRQQKGTVRGQME